VLLVDESTTDEGRDEGWAGWVESPLLFWASCGMRDVRRGGEIDVAKGSPSPPALTFPGGGGVQTSSLLDEASGPEQPRLNGQRDGRLTPSVVGSFN
jgi:hypothetical protein